MLKSSAGFILVVLVFLCCNSCKKKNPGCGTAPDCQVIGKYLVSAHSTYASGPNRHDSAYANIIITITEVTPGVISFTDTSLNEQFNASYDSSQSRADIPVFRNEFYDANGINDIYISISGRDTISVSRDCQLGASTGSHTAWYGVRVN